MEMLKILIDHIEDKKDIYQAILVNNRNGILVKNKDHNALVKGLKDFTKSLNTFDKKLIREECLKNYSAEVIVNKIKEIYKQICK